MSASVASAKWIGIEDEPAANQWIAFRGQVDVKHDSPLTAKIAVDSKYWLWIDGELVVFEGGLKRGPSPTSTYVDEVNLSPYLGAGSHEIAVLVWYFGKDGFSHKSSGRPGLFFELRSAEDPTRILATSDGTWKASLHPAFGQTGPPHPNYRLPESNIHFDARRDVEGWQTSVDLPWPAAIELGNEGDEPWGELVPRPIPLWKDFGVRSFVNDAELELPRVSDGQPLRCRLPYNAQVTPVMQVSAEAGQKIGVQTDNYRGGSAPNVRGVYVTKEGSQSYENLGWMNGHEVIFDIPAGVRIERLQYRETGFNTEPSGTFECDDLFLNRLRQKAVRTLYITMRDTYFDCPDRERAQWWGDAVLELGESFYALDPRSHLLARKGIHELMNWQRDDDTIYSPVPSGNYDSELPMQMLASVGRYGFATYALHSGDLETVEAIYDRVADYLSIWKLNDDGLVVQRKGGWTWGDWGENKDMPLLYNGWYYLALDGQRTMAQMIGRDDDVPAIEQTMKRLADAFNQTFWNGEQYRSPAYQGKTDDRGHALAVISGIADESKYSKIENVFRQQRHSSPYMEKYVLEALYRMRRPALAIERIKQRYKPMVESELTTLWEGWGIGSEGFGGGTINHAWSGGPLTIMSEYIAGVQPTSPGYATFRVDPQLGPLQFATAHVDSVAGPIDVDLRRREDGSIDAKIRCPESIEGEFVFPDGKTETIVGGKPNEFCVLGQEASETTGE